MKKLLCGATALAAFAFAAPTRAEDPPKTWLGGITVTGQIEGGVTANPVRPNDRLNFGHLFTDRANEPLLNQAALTIARTIDPKETGFDVGFKLQGLYGSDARYTHFLGEFDRTLRGRNQLDIVEAHLTMHLPVLTEGGIDLKLGQFSTPMGAETIDPSTNPFYTHSYIFNFGLPFKQTGGYANLHLTPIVDVYFGVDTGVNTSFGPRGDNNKSQAVMFGFGLNFMDGALTVLALSHIGPETPTRTISNASRFNRYLNDITLIYKATDKLTLTTELNYVKDDFARADGYGIAQYASYAVSDNVTFNARAEVFRDGRGFFVGAFPGNADFLNAQLGRPATVLGGTSTNYGALTLGLTWKPDVPKPLSGLMIRPEFRMDRAFDNSRPFNGGRDNASMTFATDIILQF